MAHWREELQSPSSEDPSTLYPTFVLPLQRGGITGGPFQAQKLSGTELPTENSEEQKKKNVLEK
jgi:hypothetical protein